MDSSYETVLFEADDGSKLRLIQTTAPWKDRSANAFVLGTGEEGSLDSAQANAYRGWLGSSGPAKLGMSLSGSRYVAKPGAPILLPDDLITRGPRVILATAWSSVAADGTNHYSYENAAIAARSVVRLARIEKLSRVIVAILGTRDQADKLDKGEVGLRMGIEIFYELKSGRRLPGGGSAPLTVDLYTKNTAAFSRIVEMFPARLVRAKRRLEPRYRTHSTADEACIGAPEQAEALASFFHSSQDELCFGLFGHWGRGKTFLMDLVADELAGKFETVKFSAWKYPSTPRLWVHLYETIRSRALRTSLLDRPVRLFRIGLARHGPWGYIAAAFVLALLVVLPVLDLGSIRYWLMGGVGGLAGLGVLGRFLWDLRIAGPSLREKLLVSSHGSKLGLQAVVGDDLRALILGWMPRHEKGDALEGSMRALPSLCWHAACLSLAAAFLASSSAGSVPLGWILCVLAPLAYGGGALIWERARRRESNQKRLLIAIDDLDRCEPSALLEVAESLKVLLDDEDIRRRVHVVMLIDETILAEAIVDKYKYVIDDREDDAPPDEEHLKKRRKERRKERIKEIIEENIEKLFIASFRLHPLTPQDLGRVSKALTEKLLHPEPGSALREVLTEHVKKLNGGSQKDTDPDRGDRALKPPPPVSAGPQSESLGLNEADAAAIEAEITAVDEQTKSRRLGPRSVRCYIARYQLGRQILRAIGESRPPDKLAKATAPNPKVLDQSDRVLCALEEQLRLTLCEREDR